MRIKEWYGLHASILRYLQNPRARATATGLFTIPSNDIIRKFISHLLNRLEDNTTSVTATVTAAAENAMDTVLEKQKLWEQTFNSSWICACNNPVHHRIVDPCRHETTTSVSTPRLKPRWPSSKTPGRGVEVLHQIHHYLMTIPPTWV